MKTFPEQLEFNKNIKLFRWIFPGVTIETMAEKIKVTRSTFSEKILNARWKKSEIETLEKFIYEYIVYINTYSNQLLKKFHEKHGES